MDIYGDVIFEAISPHRPPLRMNVIKNDMYR